jgi:multiple sugar transport system permease protein/sn-glycerol 3-phosphate transport system permease protein
MATASRAVSGDSTRRTRRLVTWRWGGAGWEKLAPYFFVLPVLALMATFIYWPLAYSVYLSLLDWNFVSSERAFVGLANYAALLVDDGFRLAARNTALYLLALVPIAVFLPLAMALLLRSLGRSRAQTPYRVLLFAPTVVAFPVAAVIWLWIFNPVQSVLNQAIRTAGLGNGPNWLANPGTAFWAVVLVCVWKLVGANLLLYLAALEAVPAQYVEAAQVDGAGPWETFRDVRWPLIRPTVFFLVVAAVIFVSDQAFGAIYVLTDGGPFGQTSNLLYFLYERGFEFFQIGEASAVSLLVFALVAVVTWLQFRYIERRVHYG